MKYLKGIINLIYNVCSVCKEQQSSIDNLVSALPCKKDWVRYIRWERQGKQWQPTEYYEVEDAGEVPEWVEAMIWGAITGIFIGFLWVLFRVI